MELLLSAFAVILLALGALSAIIDASMVLWPPKRKPRRKAVSADVARRRSIVYGDREEFFRDVA